MSPGILKNEFHFAPHFRREYGAASRSLPESVAVIKKFKNFIESLPEGTVLPIKDSVTKEDKDVDEEDSEEFAVK